MVTGEDDVVVTDRVGKEIIGLSGIVEADDLLGAAEVGLGLVADELTFGNETAGKVG